MRRAESVYRPGVLALTVWALLGLGLPAAQAQQPTLPFPRLFTVTPPGGKIGTAVEITIGGADLEEANALYFNHPGFKVERVPEPAKPPAKPDAKPGDKPADKPEAKPEAKPEPPKFVPNKFKVTIEGNVPPGIYDVRAIGKWGVSNPRAFAAGELNEVLEKEANNDVPQAQKIDLNTTVSGVINPNVDVDLYSFTGNKGQRVLIVCEASSIDSRADPRVELYHGNRLLAANRRYLDRDAVLDYVLPADGEYLVRVTEFTHIFGSPEHFYRLSVSVGPRIDAVFPPLVEPGKPAQVTLFGRNLPNGQPEPKAQLDGRPLDKLVVSLTPPADPLDRQRLVFSGMIPPPTAGLDGMEHRVKNAAGSSNPVLLTYVYAPVVLDNEDNDTPEKAQTVPVPCEVCGRIEKKRDRDWYVFTAKANEIYTIEGYADRLGSPMDLFFELRRADNKQSLGEVDDPPQNDVLSLVKFNTRSDDPKTRITIPADGQYQLFVSSREADLQAGPRHIYRVSIRKDQPDFRLVLVDNNDSNPDACTVRQGGNADLQVLIFRHDGFEGDVTITAEGLPQGVTCPPQVLGAGLKQTSLVLSAAADAPAWAGEIKIKGTATLNGQQVVREARGGCMIWPVQPQANIPALSRLSRTVCLAVREKGPFALQVDAKEIAVPLGGAIQTKVKINRLWPDFKAPVQIQALAQPQAPNAPIPPQLPVIATIAPDKPEVDVKLQVSGNVRPGVFNLVFRGQAQAPFNKDPNAKQKQPVNVIEPSTPVKVTVYNQVAELSVNNANLTLKAGGDAELVVKVNRQHAYTGEFKVLLVPPQGYQGVTAAEVTIPANMNEAKLALKSPANAAPAANQACTVRAVANVQGVTLTHETKVNVTVQK